MRTLLALATLALISGCSLPKTYADLELDSPQEVLRRPEYLRDVRSFGHASGGFVGGVSSPFLLPVTWPMTAVHEESLGQDRDSLLFAPVPFVAAGGGFVLAAPLEALDHIFYRAWIDDGNDLQGLDVQPPPVGPGPPPVRAEPEPESEQGL